MNNSFNYKIFQRPEKGIIVINSFLWVGLLLISLLLSKGIESIIEIWKYSESSTYAVPYWGYLGNIVYGNIIYILLLINIIILIARYLVWGPWPIFIKQFDLINNNEPEFSKVIYGLTHANYSDVAKSVFLLTAEFFISYMAIITFHNIKISILYLIALPFLDFILLIAYTYPKKISIKIYKCIINFTLKGFLNSALHNFIKKVLSKKYIQESITYRNLRNNVYYRKIKLFIKSNFYFNIEKKHYLSKPQSEMPRIFILPNFIDILIPIIAIGIYLIVFTENRTISNYFSSNYDYNIVLASILLLLFLFSNILVINRLKPYYKKIGYVYFKLDFLKASVSHKDRPIQYKNSLTTFNGMELYVDSRAYIPTEETTFLISNAINILKDQNITRVVLDVGTGIGNIAISIGKAFPDSFIYATDVSHDSLLIAKSNIDKSNLNNISLIEANLLKSNGRFDFKTISPSLIIANLPYGSKEHLLPSNKINSLKYMPKIAIFPNEMGIVGEYIKLIEQINRLEWETTLLIETGPIPEDELSILFNNYSNFKFIKKDKYYSICRFNFLST